MQNTVACFKWRLESTEFIINANKYLVETWNNSNLTHSKDYYQMKADNSAFVCIPMSFNELPVYYMDLVYCVLWFISIIFLLLSIIIHLLIPKNSNSKPLLFHMISLTLQYVLRLSIVLTISQNNIVLATIFWYMAAFSVRTAFCWLTIINYDMWKHLRLEQNTIVQCSKRKFRRQFLFAVIVPLLIVFTTYAGRYCGERHGTNQVRQTINQIIILYSWTETILAVNVVLFYLTIRNLYLHGDVLFLVNNGIYRRLRTLYVKLMVLTGICWILEALNWALLYQMPAPISVLTEVITALQGFFLFLVYNCNSSRWKHIYRRIHASKLLTINLNLRPK